MKLLDPQRYPVFRVGNRRVIFIHINKNAGSSVNKAFQRKKLHLTVLELMKLLGESEFESAFKFTVVRNPYDRILSQYMHRVKTNQTRLLENPISFNTWVDKVYGTKRDYNYYNEQYKMFFTQKEWLCDESGHVRVDRILRFETIDEDFNVMCKELGIKRELPHINKSSCQLLMPQYKEQSKQLIFNYFYDDFDLFSYDADLP